MRRFLLMLLVWLGAAMLFTAVRPAPTAADDVSVTVTFTSQTVSDGVILRIYVRNNETDAAKSVPFMRVQGPLPSGMTLLKCWTGLEPADGTDEAKVCITEGAEAVFFSPGVAPDKTNGPFNYKVKVTGGASVQARVTWTDHEVKSSTLSIGTVTTTTTTTTTTSALPTAAAPPAAAGDPNRRYFAETGHNLSFGFKVFWESNNGALWLGPPLTEELLEGGKVVQYFRNGRLEWSATAGVTVGTIGTDYLRLRGLLQ